MRLAVTGGAGFLGYHLCKELSDKYEEILVLDIAPIKPEEYPPTAKYINVDIRDAKRLSEVFKGIDHLVHGAAALPLWKRKEIFDINVKGTRNVLEAARANDIERVVYVSSTAVYGVPKKHPIYEDDPLSGVGPYGESKVEAEEVCREYREKGMCIPVIRPKTFIGGGRLGVFQILYDWVESGKKIPIIGKGKNLYQLLEVKDLVEAIYMLLTTPSDKVNDVFNIGAEEFRTVLEDLSALYSFAGKEFRAVCVPAWLAKPPLALFEKLKLSPLYQWVYDTVDKDSYVSIEKIKNTLGWSPKYSNTQALIRSYKWYLEHKGELSGTGLTHRVAWNQGILGFAKKFF